MVFTQVILIITGAFWIENAAFGQARADINARDERGLTALERAVNQGDIDSVNALIQAGVDVNLRSSIGRTALSWAAFRGQLEIVQALAQAGADLNVTDQQGWTPLSSAFEAEHFDVVKALIERGANVNLVQVLKDLNSTVRYGETALTRAAIRGDISSFRALIQLGADVSARHNSGRTLMFGGRLDVLHALIEAGADVNVKDNQGWTPLMVASGAGRTGIVQTLIEAGADANVEGPGGWNALMRASYFDQLETVRVLIPATNVNHRNKMGITALMLARWGCHPEIVEALTQAGAVIGVGEWRRAPRFDDFPASRIYKGVTASPDLSSNPEARNYRTRLRQGARKGPNFAGHYTVVSWGCGSNCEATMLVDAVNGRVFYGFGDERGAEFKLNSNLVIADPADPPGSNDNPTSSLPVRYYVWNENRFKLIYEEACSALNEHQKCGCESLKGPVVQPALK